MKALGCKEYWLTETGGLYKFGSFWSKKTYKGCTTSSSCQVKATKYMFSLAKKYKKIKRLYVYTWFGGVTPRFDAGLVANGSRAQGARRDPQVHVGSSALRARGRKRITIQAALWAAWSLRSGGEALHRALVALADHLAHQRQRAAARSPAPSAARTRTRCGCRRPGRSLSV